MSAQLHTCSLTTPPPLTTLGITSIKLQLGRKYGHNDPSTRSQVEEANIITNKSNKQGLVLPGHTCSSQLSKAQSQGRAHANTNKVANLIDNSIRPITSHELIDTLIIAL